VSRPQVDAVAIRAHHRVMRADPSTIDRCRNISAVASITSQMPAETNSPVGM
jgi:hypothetical protein